MNLHEELVERIARRRAAKLGNLSPSAYAELVIDARDHVNNYLDDPSDQVFAQCVDAIERVMRSRKDDEWREDDAFMEERERRMNRLAYDASMACSLDPTSVHARLLAILAASPEPDAQLDALLDLERAVDEERGPLVAPPSGDAWHDVFLHGRLRLWAAISRTCLDSARYRKSLSYARDLINVSPEDVLGARNTAFLCLARLEDEEGFDELDARFGRRGNSWQQLARVLLLYKLGRMPAARRALRGYADLCEGGAYALLRPIMADTYLFDRPAAEPYSFAEVTLAVHEADPIVCDVPDFCTWAEAQDGFGAKAQAFAQSRGYNW